MILRLVSAALMGVSLVVALIALEIGVRLWDGVPLLSPVNFVDRELNVLVNPRNAMVRFDERLGWAQADNYSWLENGIRTTFGQYGARMPTPEIVPLQQGAILVVGDSFAGGSEVNDAESWPAQLEQMTGIQVINAAVGGYGIDQIALRAEDLVPRLKPRMLLVSTNLAFGIQINRMSIAAGAPKPYFQVKDGALVLRNEPVPRGASRTADIGWVRSVFGYSYLLHFAMTRLDLLQWWVSPANLRNHLVLSDNEAVEVSCLLTRRLGELRDHYGIPVALVFQYGWSDPLAPTLSWEKDRAYIAGCAERTHLPVVDILAPLHAVYEDRGIAAYRQLWMMHDAGRAYGHMSAAGNKLVASLVFRALPSPNVSAAKPQSAGAADAQSIP